MSTNEEEKLGGKEGRANWSKELLYLYCDICDGLLQRSKGKSGATTSQRMSWKVLEVEFRKKTNLSYGKSQVRSKFDWMKSRWSLWKQLKGKETGLGWDHEKGTISASEDWWEEKIKENPKFSAFKDEGIEQELEHKMDKLFRVSSACGMLKHTPSMTSSPQVQLNTPPYIPSMSSDENIDTPSLSCTESLDNLSVYHGQTVRHDFWTETNDSQNPIPSPTPSPAPLDESERRRGKRVIESEGSQGNKIAKTASSTSSTKRGGIASLILENMQQMQESITARNTAKMNMMNLDAPTHSLADALAKLLTIPNLEPGTPLFSFACSLVEDPMKRTIMFCMPHDQAIIGWLKFLFDERKAH